MLATSCDRTRSWHSERRNHQSSLDPMSSNSAGRINRLIRLHSTQMVLINTKTCNASVPIDMWNPYISNGNPSPYHKLEQVHKICCCTTFDFSLSSFVLFYIKALQKGDIFQQFKFTSTELGSINDPDNLQRIIVKVHVLCLLIYMWAWCQLELSQVGQ